MKSAIKKLEINVLHLANRVSKQENYLMNVSKLSKGYAVEASALVEMKSKLKLEELRLSNAECMCF